MTIDQPTKPNEKLLIQEQLLQVNQDIKNELKSSEIFGTVGSLDFVNSQVDLLLTSFNNLGTYFHNNLDFKPTLIGFKSQIVQLDEMSTEITKLKIIKQYLDLQQLLIGETNNQRIASILRELDLIMKDIDIGILDGRVYPIIEKEHLQAIELKNAIKKQALGLIQTGLITNDLVSLQQGVQIFTNLEVLQPTIAEIISNFESMINQEAITQFDAKIINDKIQELKLTGKEMILNWAQILWNRVETLLDLVYTSTQKILYLEQFLSKQGVSQPSLASSLGRDGLLKGFFANIAVIIQQVMDSSSKKYPNLHQMLYAGYPKLLRKFLDLFQKLSLITDASVFKESILHGILKYQNLYLGRVTTRLLESVGKVGDNGNDCNRVIKAIQQELVAVQFDATLSEKVSNLVQRTSLQYRSTCMQSLKIHIQFKVTSTHPGVIQQAKLNTINYFNLIADELFELNNEFINNQHVSELLLKESTDYTNEISTILEQVLVDIVNDLIPTIAKLNEPKQISELVAKVRWVFRQVLCKLQISNIVSISKEFVDRILNLVITSLSMVNYNENDVKATILTELNELEYATSQSLLLIGSKDTQSLFDQFNEFKFFLANSGN